VRFAPAPAAAAGAGVVFWIIWFDRTCSQLFASSPGLVWLPKLSIQS
jgi:hypothetical protein